MQKSHYISFAALSLIVAVIPFVCNIYYVTPDDPRYIGLVSGAYTGTPLRELVYVGTLLGGMESWLYTVLPNFEWYSIVYFLCTLLSFCSLLFCTLSSRLSILLKYTVTVLITILQIHFSLTPQFTILATQLSFTSLVVFLMADKRKLWYFLCLVLFFLATQIRLAAALLPYMVAFPIFLLDVNHRDKAWLTKNTWVLGLLAVACFSFMFDCFNYRSEEWMSFHSTNNARGYLADNPIAGTIINGITDTKDKLAFDLFYRYRIFDLNILTPEKMHEYQSVCSEKALKTIRYNVRPYLLEYWKMGLWIVLLTGFLLVYELIRKKRWWILFIYGTAVLFFIVANLQMMSFSFCKERVVFFPFVTLLFITLYLCFSYVRQADKIVLAVAVFFAIQYLPRDYREIRHSMTKLAIVKETETMILQAGNDKVMLTVPTWLTPEAFQTSVSPIYTHSVIQGWMHFYPKSNAYQHFTAFIEGLPLLVDKTATEQIYMIQQLLEMHYKINTYVKTINESDHYVLVKIENT